MGLVTRQIGPDAKGSKLTFTDMDNNLYYLQSKGVSDVSYSANTLTLTNPTGGTLSVTISADTNTFTTGATLNGATLEINRNNGEPQISVDLSPLSGGSGIDTYVTGATLTGTTLEINRNNGEPQINVDLSPLNGGVVKIYSAQITNLGNLNVAPQVDALFVNTFDGPINPAQNFPVSTQLGRIAISSTNSEFTLGKTYVSATVVGGSNYLNSSIGTPPYTVTGGPLSTGTIQLFTVGANGVKTDTLTIHLEIKVYA